MAQHRQLRGPLALFTRTYRIGLNEAKRRAEGKPDAGTVGSIEDSPIEDAPDWSEAPEFRAEQGDLRRVLEEAIRALPIEYRAPPRACAMWRASRPARQPR